MDDNAAQAGYVIAQTVRGGVTHTLTSEGADASEDGTGRGTPIVVTPLALRGRADGAELEAREPGSPANSLRTPAGGASQALVAITAPEAYQCHGSNVGPMGTLRQGNGGVTGGVPFTHTEAIVRRLTELECERLQGYPDEYTDDQSGSARYRQLGNSVAVPVVEFIARRMVAIDERNRA